MASLMSTGGGEVPPYMGYIGMCGPKGYGFLAVLVRNRIWILGILASSQAWFLHFSLELGILFLEKAIL